MRLLQALKQDLKFQFRHGFYHAYLVISALYIGLLLYIPGDYRALAAGIVVFSDPAMLGFFFVGALILLERGENILEGLFVTPLRVGEYLAARVISLTVLAVGTALVISVAALGSDFNFLLFFIGVVLTAVFFSLLGVTLAVKVETVNQYLMVSILYSIIISLPLFEFLGLFETFLFYLWPTRASLVLIFAAFGFGVSWGELIFSVVILSVWIVIAFRWAYDWFYKYIILKIGDEQ